MKKCLKLILLLMLINETSLAMGLFRPRQVPKEPTPVPDEQPIDDEVTTPDPGREPGSIEIPVGGIDSEKLDFGSISTDVVDYIVGDVDPYFGMSELDKVRSSDDEHDVDHCHQDLVGKEKFAEQISFYVNEHLLNLKPELAQLSSYYSIPSKMSDHKYSGLIHHPLCHSTSSTLSRTLKNVPSSTVIKKLNVFEDKVNDLRAKTLGGDQEAKVELVKTWSKFMGCLSYVESLTTADGSSSYNVARKYAPSGYRKPAGVKFYEDPYQPAASKLNIGLFQFTPNKSGNINACLRHYNKLYPSCAVKTSSSQGELVKMFGSSKQGMNAFCGVNKVAQTFAVQINTWKSSSTHPTNKTSSGFKPAEQRCVTPWIKAGYGYNHFGPLQNSTKSNLNKLMSCVLAE